MDNYVDNYIMEMIKQAGTDIHLPSGCCPMIRVYGKLKKTDLPVLNPEDVNEMAMNLLSEEDKDIFLKDKNIDLVYEVDNPELPMNRFRTNIFIQKNGLNIVFRGIPRKIPTLEELGLPEALEKLIYHHHGMVLVTGPSGCGKTSTLAALIELMNKKRSAHIITIEDPIEYVFKNKNSLIIQRQVRRDVDKFSTALKACLREDPDVIMVGEMRDLETIQLAISAAETGHLVFSSLHTNNAISTVNRIIDAFPQEQQSQIRTMFSESLRGVISQQLIPRTDRKGRVAAVEVLLASSSVSNLIRENKVYQIFSTMQTGKKHGMSIMDDSLIELVKAGIITRQDALERAIDIKNMEQVMEA
ncbi:MAG: type IV pilus twitching motility protein PilT [Candidatus Eremiobacterota bacterium]